MITFIEQSDVEKATSRAVFVINKEIAHYQKDASPDPTTVSTLIIGSMRSARNVFLLELVACNLIGDVCFRKLHDTEESKEAS